MCILHPSDYYFSVDNLCKDLFLRKHMDSQGFVFLSVITDFNRIRQLTQDVELVRYACLQSRVIDFRTGPDGLDRLRPRDGWKQWVLAREERVASAQNDGPGQLHQPRMPQPMGMEGPGPLARSTHPTTSPTEMNYPPPINGVIYPPTSEVTSPTGPIMSPPLSNGNANVNADSRHHHVALSAVVPDFAPASQNPATHGLGITRTEAENGQDIFSDSEMENLVIVVRKQGSSNRKGPFHDSASRTYSNGSIDERMIADAIGGSKAQPTDLPNGRRER